MSWQIEVLIVFGVLFAFLAVATLSGPSNGDGLRLSMIRVLRWMYRLLT